MYYNDLDLGIEDCKFDALVKEYREGINKFANTLFERTDLTEYQKLCILHASRILPLGTWMDECPVILYNIISEEVEYKYAPIYFVDMLNIYKDSFDNIDDAIHEVYEWVKENKLIGTHLDW